MVRWLIFVFVVMSHISSTASPAQPVARISALASGQLLLDGQPTSLPALDKALGELKRRNGSVWYYRENPRAEPSAQAMQAIQLVVMHELPISMSTKPDFSDYVDAKGLSQLRKP